MEDHTSHPYSTTPEILGMDASNTQMFVCFDGLVLELAIENTIFLYIDLAGFMIEILSITMSVGCIKAPHNGHYVIYLDPSKEIPCIMSSL